MDTGDQEIEAMANGEERNEDIHELLNSIQENINGGHTPDLATNGSPYTVKREISEERGIQSAKGDSNHSPLSTATSSEYLQKDEDSKALESETEQVMNNGNMKPCSCTSPHDGRQLVNLDLKMHVDQLFTMVFTQSSFYLNFHSERKTTDIVQTPWEEDPETGGKKKKVELTVSLNKAVGPKTSRVTENFSMFPCSKPSQLYSIDMCAYNSGFRYADAFHCFTHFCLCDTTLDSESKENNMNAENMDIDSRRVSHMSSATPNFTCHFSVFSQLVYTKSVWTPVKALIDKSSWIGLEEFYDSLTSKLKEECGHGNIGVHNISDDNDIHRHHLRKRKKGVAGPGIEDAVENSVDHTRKPLKMSKGRRKKKERLKDRFSWILLFITIASFALLNVFLCYKLKDLEEITTKTELSSAGINLNTLKINPGAYIEWLALPLNMGGFHDAEMETWRNTLNKVVDLLEEVEVLLTNLTRKIPLETRHRVMIASLHKTTHSSAKDN